MFGYRERHLTLALRHFRTLVRCLSLVSSPILTRAGQPVKTIAIYTIKTLCFSKVTNHDNDQAIEGYVGCRQSLRFSFGVVASILVAVILLVGINIAADGSSHFYGPTGFCKPMCISSTSDIDMAQGAGFSPVTPSSALLPTSFSCG
jgi:hypothetical protein